MMTRVFAAPRNLVFDAMNKPELLKRWLLGPPGWSMVVCEVDSKVGGAFRHVWRQADGTEMGMGGVYHEIKPPERIVRTEKFDDYPGQSLCTLVLTEPGGGTTLALTVLYPSKDVRAAMIASGMKDGVAVVSDGREEASAQVRQRTGSARAQTIAKGVQCLQGALEANLPRRQVVFLGRLSHDLADQVVGQQVRPNFFANHRRTLATQYVHLHKRL